MKCLVLLSVTASCAALLAGCGSQNQAAKATSPPAKVITENDLASIVLKPEAEKRLGISTSVVTMEKVGRKRMLGGELLLPLGRRANTSQETSKDSKSIYALLPAMTPADLVRVAEMQLDADGKIVSAKVQLEEAKVALSRARNLVSNHAGTQRSLDEAQAQVRLSETAWQIARDRRALLGEPLFDAVHQDVLWVRVPVYAGEIEQIDLNGLAQVDGLSGRSSKASRTARPVTVPFTTSVTGSTIDLFYELENKDAALRPGQKVTVGVPIQGEGEGLVVHKAAVLYDIHGGTWVYESTAPNTFARRRVEIRYFSDAGAVLARGLQAGTKIVTDGAAELFGTEFGIGK